MIKKAITLEKLSIVASSVMLTACLVLLTARNSPSAWAQTDLNESAMEFGTDLIAEVQLGMDGGTNQFGKKTTITGNGLNFGPVTFTNPENVGNGDAYISNGKLMLEAIIDVNLVFSGASSVTLNLSELPVSSNPFSNTYYSTSVNRDDKPELIYTNPQTNRVTSETSGETTTTLRMILEISPQQSGHIFDRFRLEASAL